MRMLMLDCLQRLCFYDQPELSFVSTPFPSNATVSFLLAATDVTVDVPLMQYLTCKEKEIVFWLQGVNQCCNSGLQSSRFCLVDCCQHGILKCTEPYNSRKAQHIEVIRLLPCMLHKLAVLLSWIYMMKKLFDTDDNKTSCSCKIACSSCTLMTAQSFSLSCRLLQCGS